MKGQFFLIKTDGSYSDFTRDAISLDEATVYVGSPATLVRLGKYAACVNDSEVSSDLSRNAVFQEFNGNVLVGGGLQNRKLVGMSGAKSNVVLAIIRKALHG
jgi:hypothetical protein